MMDTLSTSETSVYSENTWRYVPEDSHLEATIVLGVALCYVMGGGGLF
jgi:hypothetical protein